MNVTFGKGQSGVNFANFSFASGVGTSYVANPWEINGKFDDLLKPADITALFAAGARTIRYAVDPTPLCMTTQDWQLDAPLGILFNPIRQFTSAGFKVILDMHFQDFPAIPNTGYDTYSIMGYTTTHAKFVRVKQVLSYIASKLAQYYGTLPVAFGLLNEPPGDQPNYRNVLLPNLFQAVRAAAPNLTIVVAGDTWANASGLVKLNPANFDSNTVYDFHSYLQHIFTHQAVNPAYVAPNHSLGYFSGVPFPPNSAYKAATVKRFQDNVANQIWGPLSASEKATILAQGNGLLDYYFNTPCDKAFIKAQDYVPLQTWMIANSIPADRVILGETGAWGDILGKQGASQHDRVAYLSAQRELCDEYNIAFTAWELLGTSNTAWNLVPAFGQKRLSPDIQAALFGTPVPAPAPTPPPPAPVTPTVLTKGSYQLPGGVIVTVP